MSVLLLVLLRAERSWPLRLHWGKVSPCKATHKVQNYSGLLVYLFIDVCTQSHTHCFQDQDRSCIQQQNLTRLRKQNSPWSFIFSSDILVPPTSTHISIVNAMQAEHILQFKEMGLKPASISKKKGTSKLIVKQNHFYWCKNKTVLICISFLYGP